MKTAGEILAAARAEKGWSLAELSRRTKIQIKFLKAIELSQFAKLPEAPFTKGLVRTAAGQNGKKTTEQRTVRVK
jgi:cytoskeletal protein RodZ